MQPFPHSYSVNARALAEGDVTLTAGGVPSLRSASPAEFDGPGDRWSPETLLVAAVGDCFVLTFRAVARASKLPWTAVHCGVTGTLDRLERATQFTAFDLRVSLHVPIGTDEELARRALDKAERGCLISSSLKAPVRLTMEIVSEDALGRKSA